ncbi:UNVERIFIED_CONTAM: Cis-abienol synthase, chloroplastic [Sesamum calycinum]|uniref:Cis-abienol synthase, chloroplastic n=1 Tax=Sesamum calycinum TaxID=2727403 RepID=A0AAW2M1Q7_9LAMI
MTSTLALSGMIKSTEVEPVEANPHPFLVSLCVRAGWLAMSLVLKLNFIPSSHRRRTTFPGVSGFHWKNKREDERKGGSRLSAYDTAWVAMVPSREDSGREPLFPQCLDWIIENQNPDGSWGLQHPGHPLLVKDSLSCTLACLVALRKWNAGDQLVKKGLEFLRSNAWAATRQTPNFSNWFRHCLPMMINYANDLDLTPFSPAFT